MGDINIDFLIQFPRLFNEVKSILKEPIQERKEKRIRFFENEIIPIHKKMYEINQDYLTNFLKIAELVREDIKNLEDTKYSVYDQVESLKPTIEKMKLTKLAERSELKAFSKVLKGMNRKNYIKKREFESFIDYADAIEYYFYAFIDNDYISNYMDRNINYLHHHQSSHYSRFIYMFNQAMENKRDDLPVNLIELCYDALQTIPLHYNAYNESFLRLKINYLE